jgi:hypothetical protein
MKRMFTLCVVLSLALTGIAQVPADTTAKPSMPPQEDTIRIGGMIIIRKKGNNDEVKKDGEYKIRNRKTNDKPSNISTNWIILDLGFANYSDKSNYTSAATSGFVASGINEDDLKLKSGKSKSVNFWFFMQKLNVSKHVVNLKYGLGLELNNYHFDNTKIVFSKKPTLISEGTEDLKKVKLAADYLTVPVMLNFNFTPKKEKAKGFGFSAGVSAGYLYSSRYKTKDGGDIDKIKSQFDLEPFKFSYVGEIALGPVKLYGSYAPKNMWSKGLDMRPFNFGFRLSNW